MIGTEGYVGRWIAALSCAGLALMLAALSLLLAPPRADAAAPPQASVTLYQYSTTVSGNIGENVAGVSVNVTLSRAVVNQDPSATTYAPIASGTATTDAGGGWSLHLSPAHAVIAGSNPDEVSVGYGAGSAPAGTPLPDDASGLQAAFVTPTISADGSVISVPAEYDDDGNLTCPDLVRVDGADHQASPASGSCAYDPSPAVTAQNLVEAVADVSQPTVDGDTIAVRSVGRAALPGVPITPGFGTPACSADLAFKIVTCENLTSGSFAISVSGGPDVPLTTSLQSSVPGVYAGEAAVTSLAAGDTVALVQTAPTATTRALTLLRVDPLQLITSPGVAVTGRCSPGNDFTAAAAAGFCNADGQVADATFVDGPDLGDETSGAVSDDLSGGSTVVDSLDGFSSAPTLRQSLEAAGFDAYFDLSVPSIGGFFTPTNAQVAAAIAGASLSVAPTGGGAPVVTQAKPAYDSYDAYAEGAVGTLTPGRYLATWTLTDVNGDRETDQPFPFLLQPGGERGPAGPAGRNGTITTILCIVTPRWSKHAVEECIATLRSSHRRSVMVQIRRGRRVFATARAHLAPGTRQLRLRLARRLPGGTYTVSVRSRVGRRVSKESYHLRVRTAVRRKS